MDENEEQNNKLDFSFPLNEFDKPVLDLLSVFRSYCSDFAYCCLEDEGCKEWKLTFSAPYNTQSRLHLQPW